MAANTLDALLDDSRYRPLLPLLHTAWADGSLTTGEIERIRSVLCDVVDGDCVPVVESWLDPDHPPSAGEVARLGRAIRDSASAAPRMGPVELGLRLAGSVPDPVAEALRTSQTRTLVTDLSEKTAGRSRHLVDAFGIPPEVLAAPIAL